MAIQDDDVLVPLDNVEVMEAEELYAAEDQDDANVALSFYLFQAAPAWFVSTVVHVLIIVMLGLVSIAEPIEILNLVTASTSGEEGTEIDEFSLDDSDPADLSDTEEFEEPVFDTSEMEDVSEPIAVEQPVDVATVPAEPLDFAQEMAPPAPTLQSLASAAITPVSSRGAEMKEKLLREYGGNAKSETAVTEALKWIALHQAPNGGWTFQHNLICRNRCGDPGMPKFAQSTSAATAMALLPFLGAGQTHMEGEFKNTVRRGLLYLAQSGKPGRLGGMPVVDYRDKAGNMYSHGLTAIALCEAYAMTGDAALIEPSQAALNYIVYAQCKDGGWRYSPQQPKGGDTSVTGWQVMALKSGYMGHLNVPPGTIKGSIRFLEKVQSNNGANYGYASPSPKLNISNTAIGLLCRMYTGWDKAHPSLIAGAKDLAKTGIRKDDIYYDYYAAQVLRHMGGADWDKFNTELRDWLVESQSDKRGSKGSWYFEKQRSHRGPHEGGRLASTAFATMILEVYYRHMPLYADSAADEFPL